VSQLVQIRQRVKAIETIKKITHAMRLISMSTHSRLKHKEEPLDTYTSAVRSLFYKLTTLSSQWKSPILQPSTAEGERFLVIIISSQKGLCGSFNSALFSLFKKKKTNYPPSTHYVVVGKKAVNFAQSIHNGTIVSAFPTFTNSTRATIVHSISQLMTTAPQPYTNVTLFSNKLKTFFVQKPSFSTIVPLLSHGAEQQKKDNYDYLWEQAPNVILEYLSTLYLKSTLDHIFFQSLFAEHAARFISMDAATRNAESLLDVTKLKYNKLRQAKITKELTELVGSNL